FVNFFLQKSIAMKTLFTNRKGILFLLLSAFTLVSCQKEQSGDSGATIEVTDEQAGTYAEESIQAEGSFDDIEDFSMIAAEEEGEASLYGRNETRGYQPLFP